MSFQPSQALYITNTTEITKKNIFHTTLESNEVLIENHYSGVNPADIRHAALGIHSTVLGYDFAGRVLRAPADSGFREGDLVAGYTPSGMGRPTKYGAHQSNLVVPDDMIFRVPSNLPTDHAAAMTVAVMTAADVIHNLFAFPLPTNPGKVSAPILIWGGSSTVGLSAIQLARASGCSNIFVTASPRRHDLLKNLGATKTFDYSSPTVVAEVLSAIEALGQGPITHALDAAGTMDSPSSSDLLLQCAVQSTVVSCVVLRPGGRFKMPVALTKDVWSIQPPGAPGPISIPARPRDHWNAWKALQWAVANYGTAFRLPSVDVLDATAEDAVQVLRSVAEGKRGFGKVVFRQPFRQN